MNLISLNFAGEKTFSLNENPVRANDWSDYARGAAMALSRKVSLHTGMNALLEGDLPLGGLSSSAAVGVAYLLGLEAANGIEVEAVENIELDRIVENEFIGIDNGILDQSVILLSKAGQLLYMDCKDGRYNHVDPHPDMKPFEILVVYSGVQQKLIETDYNKRVHECEAAARMLLAAAGKEGTVNEPVKLRHVDPKAYEENRHVLPDAPRRRADHFFSECSRVRTGLAAWRRGDLEGFGRLMVQSGISSINNYECGSPPLIALTEILNQIPGVFGARFSGAGFRGCCIGLSDPSQRASIREIVTREYSLRHPEYADQMEVHFCQMGSGARLL